MFSLVPPPRDPNAFSRGLAVFLLRLGRVALAMWVLVPVVALMVLVVTDNEDPGEGMTGALVMGHLGMSIMSPYLLFPVGSQLLVTKDGDDLWVPTVLGRRRIPRPVRRAVWIWFPAGRIKSSEGGAILLRSGWRWVVVASLGNQEDVDSRLGWVVDWAVKVAGPGAPIPRGADGSVRSWPAYVNDFWAFLAWLGLAAVVFVAPLLPAVLVFGW